MPSDAYTIESTNRSNGKITTQGRWTASKDGKTLTATVAGTFPDGRRANIVRVFDRQ